MKNIMNKLKYKKTTIKINLIFNYDLSKKNNLMNI
jgi:hypothetical protein